ncbi:PspA/IM30 family protein [Marinicrinis lubricantis]|uniref:PspA/IM30 family protein n=1 Tax=Marinicrinis lubricantis TaxID=2086470 RepID=A0ABW1IJ97_9BACL
MGIFKRIRDISAAAIHDLIDKAEDPVKLLNQYLRDMEDDIADAEVAVAKQIAVEKKFRHQYEEAEEMAEKRQSQAVKALESGNEELARKALKDKKEHQQKADEFKGLYESAKENADMLRGQLREMKQEFEKMKSRKTVLIARAETAKAQKKVNETMVGLGKDTSIKGFERMNEKVMQLEAEAEAGKELGSRSRSLDAELAALDDDGIEDELAALKAKLKQSKDDSPAE